MTAPEVFSLRQSLKLSQSDFAKLVGVDISTVWRWEHDRLAVQGPALAHLERIKRDLEVQPETAQ